MNKGLGISFQLALGQSRILPHSQTLHSPALPARPLLFLQQSCRSQSRQLVGRPAGGARAPPLYFWAEREGSVSLLEDRRLLNLEDFLCSLLDPPVVAAAAEASYTSAVDVSRAASRWYWELWKTRNQDYSVRQTERPTFKCINKMIPKSHDLSFIQKVLLFEFYSMKSVTCLCLPPVQCMFRLSASQQMHHTLLPQQKEEWEKSSSPSSSTVRMHVFDVFFKRHVQQIDHGKLHCNYPELIPKKKAKQWSYLVSMKCDVVILSHRFDTQNQAYG